MKRCHENYTMMIHTDPREYILAPQQSGGVYFRIWIKIASPEIDHTYIPG